MAYIRKVALQRRTAWIVEMNHKRQMAAASAAGKAGLEYQAERYFTRQAPEGENWLRRMLDTMLPERWKSRRRLEKEEAARKAKEKEAKAK